MSCVELNAVPYVIAAGAFHVITGFALLMVNVCGTPVAVLKFVSPVCDAVIVQEPAPVMWTVATVTVQFPLAPKLTARLEVLVALTLKSASR